MISSHWKWLRTLGILVSGLCILALSRLLIDLPLRHDLVRDLGIAVVVAALVSVFIEYQREQETRRDAVDVFVGRIIPVSVWEDFRGNIIANEVTCESWDLDIFVTADQVTLEGDGAAKEQYVATGTMVYKLNNLTRRTKSIQLLHELENDFRGTDRSDAALPRFIQMTCTPASGTAQSWDEAEMTQHIQEGKLKIPLNSLPPTPPGPVEIVVKRKEIIPIPGGYPWYMNWITLKCKITIRTNVEGITFDLWPRHHDHERFRALLPGETWSFEGVLLPGQGFEIQCRRQTRDAQ